MTPTDLIYRNSLWDIYTQGDLLPSRNGWVQSLITSQPLVFTATPLVTLRKTAWKLALREMEWFLSGDPKCPDELAHWWAGQLNEDGNYIAGYGMQLRDYGYRYFLTAQGWDQIAALIDGLRTHPNGRRHITTTWNPVEMHRITGINSNPNTPTTCHGTTTQYFVRQGKLHISTYQRSADVLLGVPHNWMQYWAFLLWLAYHCGYEPGSLRWMFGDLHLYQHPTHLAAAQQIRDVDEPVSSYPHLRYVPKTEPQEIPVFYAGDFEMVGEIPEPVVKTRPVLL